MVFWDTGYSPMCILGYGILTLFILGYGIFRNFGIRANMGYWNLFWDMS